MRGEAEYFVKRKRKMGQGKSNANSEGQKQEKRAPKAVDQVQVPPIKKNVVKKDPPRRPSVLETGLLKRKVEDDYILGKKLGEGSYGKVRIATNKKTNEKFLSSN